MKNSLSYHVYKALFPALLIALMVSIVACQEDDSEVSNDPSVSMVLINVDSLTQVNVITDSLGEELVGYDTTLTNLSLLADDIGDSLLVLGDSINNGRDDLIPIRDQLFEELETVRAVSDSLTEEATLVAVELNDWNTVITTIESGSVKIYSIENLDNSQSVYYEDSATVWKLPLDMNADGARLSLTLDDQAYGLEVAYSRLIDTDEKGRVVVRVQNISVISTDFSSAIANCNDCLDANTTIYVEF